MVEVWVRMWGIRQGKEMHTISCYTSINFYNLSKATSIVMFHTTLESTQISWKGKQLKAALCAFGPKPCSSVWHSALRLNFLGFDKWWDYTKFEPCNQLRGFCRVSSTNIYSENPLQISLSEKYYLRMKMWVWKIIIPAPCIKKNLSFIQILI
jgi:hypothetical protein